MESFEKTSKNPKAMWNTINKLLNKKSKTTNVTELTINNESVIDKQEIANNFNEYFSNIGAKLADKIPETVKPPESYMHQQSIEFRFNELTENDVLMALRNIKSSKSTGHNRIPPNLINDTAEVISGLLTKIFSQSITTGTFPDNLKIAVVSPIYKTGAKNDCGNYRPISVLSVIAKVFEKIIIYNFTHTYKKIISSYHNKLVLGKIIQHKHPCYVLPTTG